MDPRGPNNGLELFSFSTEIVDLTSFVRPKSVWERLTAHWICLAPSPPPLDPWFQLSPPAHVEAVVVLSSPLLNFDTLTGI